MLRLLIGLSAIAMTSQASLISPGHWETNSRLVDVELAAGTPAAVGDMMRQMLGGDGMTTEQCVTQEDLEQSPERMFNETNGECEYSEFDMSGGEVYAVAQCSGPQGDINMVMDGSYTASTYDMTTVIESDMGMGPMTMTMAVTGRHTGACS